MAPVTWSAHDGSDEIGAYWPLYERRARRFVGIGGAEFDDLVQEAAMAAWQSIKLGWKPTVQVTDRACISYCRFLNTGGWRLVAEG